MTSVPNPVPLSCSPVPTMAYTIPQSLPTGTVVHVPGSPLRYQVVMQGDAISILKRLPQTVSIEDAVALAPGDAPLSQDI